MTSKLEELISLVVGGSVSAMQRLMTFVSVNPCSEDQIHRVLGALRCHLQPGTNPSILSQAAIQVIISMAATSSTNAKSSQVVINCLKQFWPHLWSWAIDLYKTGIIDAKHVPLELRLQFKDGLVRVLFPFTNKQLLQPCMLSTPEVVPTLVQLWRLEILDPDFALSTKTKEPYSTRFPVSEVLDPCFKALVDGSSEVWMESIIALFGGGAKEFATIALAHIRHDMSQKQPDLEHLIHDVRLIAYSSIYPPVRFALLSLHSIRDVTKTLVRLTLRPHSDDNKLVGRSIDACFFYLIGYLEISDSTAWIIQALDAHILCAIMSCEPWLGQLHPRRIIILSETLPKYLIYRSVLKAASRAITKVRDLELMARISEGGQLWKSWLQYEQLVEEGLSLMRSVCPDDIQMICNNRMCPTRSKQDEFRSCGGCLHVFYCGAPCQTYDWKFGSHRTFCKTAQASRLAGITSGISSRDQKFIRQTIQQEISKHKIDILEGCDKPGVRSFVVELDYTKVPVRMSCGPIETFLPQEYADNPQVRGAWDDLLDGMTGKLEEDSLVVRGVIAAGAGVKSFVQFVPLKSFRKDGNLFMMNTLPFGGQSA